MMPNSDLSSIVCFINTAKLSSYLPTLESRDSSFFPTSSSAPLPGGSRWPPRWRWRPPPSFRAAALRSVCRRPIVSVVDRLRVPEALSQIRCLTDVGAMTRLLHACVAYQRGLDLRLDSLLSSRPDLDRHLASLLRSSPPLLSLARSDSSLLLSSASSLSLLALSLSSRVRLLDLARSRSLSSLRLVLSSLHRFRSLDSLRRHLLPSSPSDDDLLAAAQSVHSFLSAGADDDADAPSHNPDPASPTPMPTSAANSWSSGAASSPSPAAASPTPSTAATTPPSSASSASSPPLPP
uniref:Uncharacterized protein n=1 Tax=Ananas comosus var. bracteatus TaxID=296719 RepID=A0A6V7QIH9_ANACO|nr:unnamed protein product [Ananas comosus var. bracteatus]